MSTTGTSFRRGTSTILGTLIFIGIMFTAVIPMLLVMRQADTLHEMRKHEITIADDERDRENIEVYPVPSLTEEMNVTLINTGGVSAEVVGIWINNTYYPVSEQISTFSSHEIGPYPAATVEDAEYEVRATSTRGNVYTSEIGTIRYEGGKWISETLGFNLIFPSRPGIKGGKRMNDWLNELKITIEQDTYVLYANSSMYWAVSASEKFFQLDEAGVYRIIVYILCTTPPGHWDKIYDIDKHSIDWPEGDPIIELNFMIVEEPLGNHHLELLE